MDAKVGGSHKMSFTNFSTGQSHSFGGTYTELVPNERIRYTDKFDDPNMPGEIQASITLKMPPRCVDSSFHSIESLGLRHVIY